MSRVYGVAAGAYSDYRVEFICLTREIADALAAKLNAAQTPKRKYQREGDVYTVEEMSMVTDVDEVEYRPSWCVWVDGEGQLLSRRYSKNAYDSKWVTGGDMDRTAEVLGISDHPDVRMFAQSYRGHDVALKAARDKLAQLKAEEAGL